MSSTAKKPFDPAREASALSSFQMIHPKEAALRRKLGGAVVLIGAALALVKGAGFLGAGAWASIFGAGIGLYRTGSLSQ